VSFFLPDETFVPITYLQPRLTFVPIFCVLEKCHTWSSTALALAHFRLSGFLKPLKLAPSRTSTEFSVARPFHLQMAA
jgi:hypothetical protein